MFREMTRAKQALSSDRIKDVLDRCTHGILACTGDGGYPYAVPLNYVFADQKIYVHSARHGHKIDAITGSSKVCFTVVYEDSIVSKAYTSYFRSVIAFGNVRITCGAERLAGFTALVEKYSGDQPDELKKKKVADCTQAQIIAIDIEHITGKEAIEYAIKNK